jgi:hypothetical protein
MLVRAPTLLFLLLFFSRGGMKLEMIHGRTIEPGQKVRVYVNLHKQGRFSIVDMKTGLVCGYASNCLLKDAIFHVSQSGRQKVIDTKAKLVHAWVRGIYLGSDLERPEQITSEVNYNPYVNNGFVNSESDVITNADLAYFTNKKVFI